VVSTKFLNNVSRFGYLYSHRFFRDSYEFYRVILTE